MSDFNDKIESIFYAAQKLRSEEELEAYLEKTCGKDLKLKADVEKLLQVLNKTSNVFDALDTEAGITEPVEIAEGPGSIIGEYKLLEKLGEGGFGVVYMAEQRKPVTRRVALKIIKLGMDTKQVVARFEVERQALALMDHQNIAKVLDAGSTDSGRPYFCLELVKGVPITDFCNKNKLNTEQRIELFTQVCNAVHHAHQKGIIHRDIKPTNVLVGLQDGTPVPKVIDFGIAKATQQRLTEKTYFTEFAQLIGTPAYMSPEQAGTNDLDVDTRTDVYSLGVLLYEILTGKPPFDPKELMRAGHEEMRRIVREIEPDKPSSKISTLTHEELSTVSRDRQQEPNQLGKVIKGELDWIVMKALEKDRSRRYESTFSFAEDLTRYLKNEPVAAVAPSHLYLLSKNYKKNRVSINTGFAFIVILLLGTFLSTYFAIKYNKEQKITESLLDEAIENAESERMIRYASDMLHADNSIKEGNISEARKILIDHVPEKGESDLRGFEWRMLWQKSKPLEAIQIKNINALQFTHDSNLAITLEEDEDKENWALNLFDIKSNRLVRTILTHDNDFNIGGIHQFFTHPNIPLVGITRSDYSIPIYIFNYQDSKLIKKITPHGTYDKLQFSPHGKYIAGVYYKYGKGQGSGYSINVCDYSDGRIVFKDSSVNNFKFEEVNFSAPVFSPDGKYLAWCSTQRNLNNGKRFSKIQCVDTSTWEYSWAQDFTLKKTNDTVREFGVIEETKEFIVAESDHISIWSMDQRTKERSYDLPKVIYPRFAFGSKNGSLFYLQGSKIKSKSLLTGLEKNLKTEIKPYARKLQVAHDGASISVFQNNNYTVYKTSKIHETHNSQVSNIPYVNP